MYCILGATGFIGGELVKFLREKNINYIAPERNEDLKGKYLGSVIFCIGLTSDAKQKPHESIEAHITKLQEIIKYCKYDKITYCSSTRVYVHTKNSKEDCLINVDVNDSFELFNLTKLTAESLLLNSTENFTVVRLSNVFGNDFYSENFITSIVKDAHHNGKITLRSTKDSSKDYIYVVDVVKLIMQITSGHTRHNCYNIAYGKNFSNDSIVSRIQELTGCEVDYTENAQKIIFPEISTERVKEEFGFEPSLSVLEALPGFISNLKQHV